MYYVLQKDSAAPAAHARARARAHTQQATGLQRHARAPASQTPHPTACPQAGIRHSIQTTI